MELNSPISKIPFVGPVYQNRLQKLDIFTVYDLLQHVPHRYLDFSHTEKIKNARIGETLTLKGDLVFIKNQYTKSGKKIQLAKLKDESGEIMLVWFNQPFLTRMLFPNDKLAVAGKVEWFGRVVSLYPSEYEKISAKTLGLHTGRLIPVYPETKGLSSKWLRGRIKDIFTSFDNKFNDFLPKPDIEKLKTISLEKAFYDIHFPKSLSKVQEAKKRLSFNELLFLHHSAIKRKLEWQKNHVSHPFTFSQQEVNGFIQSFGFTLTKSQSRAVQEILIDLKKDIPMNRLLEGDVGSGKTAVAAIAAFCSFANGLQTVIMAPTQILAEQHFQTISKLFAPYQARVNLITSTSSKKNIGRADIFIGTHSLFEKKASFENVGLVVIDEQHRFGVKQRTSLIHKSQNMTLAPHVLTMTATPIPQTIALTLYGDLDLSVLTEMPMGRIPVSTFIVPPIKREKAYAWIEKKITQEKTQVFIVCPLIEESDHENMLSVRSAKKEFSNLKKIFPKLHLGLLHGKLNALEKVKIVNDFKSQKLDILVTTPVIEVGIDIPNASIILIEAAERFGLAELHQLRGRVGRGKAKSYCLLFSQTQSEKALFRLNAMSKQKSGFELAEIDLHLRGPGEIFGFKQHGIPELKIASWQDFDLIKQSKDKALEIAHEPKKYKAFSEFCKSLKENRLNNIS